MLKYEAVEKFDKWLNDDLGPVEAVGLKEDAPEEAKKAFEEYKKMVEEAGEEGIEL